jgi:hypothetical protein
MYLLLTFAFLKNAAITEQEPGESMNASQTYINESIMQAR